MSDFSISSSKSSFDKIPNDSSIIDLLTDNKASQATGTIFFKQDHGQRRPIITASLTSEFLKIIRKSKPLLLRQHQFLSRQALSAFTTTAFDDTTAADRAHTNEEAMGFMAFPIIGLKSAFHWLKYPSARILTIYFI